MKNPFYALMLFTLIGTIAYPQSKEGKDDKKPIDSLVEAIPQSKGALTSYFSVDKQKLLIAVPKSLLKKDLLMISRYAKLPANYSPYTNAGSKSSEMVIRFEKLGDQLLLKQVSFVNLANESDPINISVTQNNFPPILATFKILNSEEDVYLVNATKYFSSDSPGFNVIGSTQKKNYGIGSVDKDRSFIDRVKSYPENIEILHTLTYAANKAPRQNAAKTYSFQMNHSIVLLPDDMMQVRYSDPRVGWFSHEQYNYSSDALKSDNYKIARHWKLVPKDIEAYNRGELVEPIKPIVYYLDPATPIKWRPYFKQGIEDWNIAFAKAGFKNAIIAKDPPTKEEDPDFSPEDVRYSTVRYVASTTRNAVGPSVTDPRTGEILESDIIWYHNHLRSYRNRYLLETAAANPKARTLDTPEEEIGEMMRRVISHEIGHALGLPHNMKASSAYAVDSLRSGNFTQKMGIATTIMDYARYNYIAQPGDENIRFVRQLGPYDDYAIEWGYRYFDGKDAQEIKEILRVFVDQKSLNPIYMFGYSSNDPNSQTENIGDDPVMATYYGLKNLKIVASNLDEWTSKEGRPYDDLKEVYGEMLSVYRRYIYHVAALIGGVNETLINKGQDATPYQNVPRTKQLEALASLKTHLWESPSWLMEAELISKFNADGILNRINAMQKSVLYRILEFKRLNRMLSTQTTLQGTALPVNELIRELQIDILEVSTPDILERNLQINWIQRLQELKEEPKLEPVILGYVNRALEETKSHFKSKRNSGSSELKAHNAYAYSLLLNADKK